MKNLRQNPLVRNIFYMYRTISVVNLCKRDIDVQKIKVENAFCLFPFSSFIISILMSIVPN